MAPHRLDESIRAILFDLDGTLLQIDLDSYMKEYFALLAPKFAHACPPQRFVEQLTASVMAMVNNTDPHKTNMDAFWEDFAPKFSAVPEDWRLVFERFYADEFPRLRSHSRRDPLAAEVVQAAVHRGFQVVLATNAVYPRVAIVERLVWAGISPDLFDLITSYEEMHFCKPNPEYYREICSLIGREPRECVMVGNDVEEDLAASTTGMRTFLVNTAVRNRGNTPYLSDYEGSQGDLLDLIRSRAP